MKIAYVNDAVYPFIKGGAEKRMYEISKRMAAKGHDVHIYGAKLWKGHDDIILDGVKLHGVYKTKGLYSGERRSIKNAVMFSVKLYRKLRKERFDIVDCYQSPVLSSIAVRLSLIGKKTKFILSWYEIWRNYWYEYAGVFGIFGKLFERIALRMPKKIIAPSNKTKKDLINMGSKKDITVVHNGINLSIIQNAKPSKHKYDVIDTSRLIVGKRIDLLIKASALLKKEFPNIRVAIVGDGPEMKALKKLTKDLDLEDNITFLGFLEHEEDVYSSIKAAKIFVHPSIQEGGSSIVLFEANACGVPVIAVKHSIGIDRELITNGKTGYFAEVSAEALAEKIKILLLDKKLLSYMGENCIEYAKKYDWDNIVENVEKVYKS